MPDVSLEKVGLAIVKKNWVWFLLMGILLIVFGATAIGRTCLMTKFSMIFIGWLMIAAGGTQIIQARANRIRQSVLGRQENHVAGIT